MADTTRPVWPTFLIIGVAKAGTTSLWEYLRQHPQVFMSQLKETNYFAYDGEDTRTFLEKKPMNEFRIKTQEQYLNLFTNAGEASAIGEASPLYLESLQAPVRIQDTLPGARIIAILRHPVDRAVSDYMLRLRVGRGTRDPEQAFREDEHIVQVGFYFEKLKRYFDRFPREQIKVALYDDLKRDTLEFVQDIYRFVDVDPGFAPDVSYSSGGMPQNRALNALHLRVRRATALKKIAPSWALELSRNVRRWNLGRFQLPSHLRQRTLDLYREDIARAGDLIDRDLSHWLE